MIRPPLFLLPLLLAATLGAQQPPAAPTPAPAPVTAPASPSDAPLPIDLNTAVQFALIHNLNLAIEKIEPAVARTEVDSARSVFEPNIDYSMDYGESSTPRNAEQIAADGTPSVQSRNFNSGVNVNRLVPTGSVIGFQGETANREDTYNQFRDEFSTFMGLTLRHPLFKNSGTEVNLSALRIAAIGVNASIDIYHRRIDDTIRQVHFAYYELLFSIADLESKTRSRDLAILLEQDNTKRLEVGTMTPLDVAQARAAAAQRRGDVLQSELLVRRNETSLKRLIFDDLLSTLNQPVLPGETLQDPAPDPPQYPVLAEGFARRSDYQALLKQAQQEGLNLKYLKNQTLPQIDISGAYGYQGKDSDFTQSFQRVLDTRDEVWRVGLTVTFPWGFLGDKAAYTAADLRRQQTLLQIKDLEQTIIQEIDNSYRSLLTARQTFETLRASRIDADKIAAGEEEKLKEGVSTSFTVLQLQRDARDARTRELRAQVDYFRAWTDLRYSQGSLLRDHQFVLE